MGLLKKIRSATLVEAIVATVLIVVIFIVSSLILNNLLLNSFSKKAHIAETRIKQLQYEAINDNIKLPYTETAGAWEIKLYKEAAQNSTNQFWIKAVATKKSYIIEKSILCTSKN